MRSLSLALCLITFSSVARAQERAADSSATVTANPPTADVEAGRLEDVSSDHSFLTPTAQTVPKGKFVLTDYLVIVGSLSYGLTDRLQLSVTSVAPIFTVPMVAATAKWQFLHRDRFRMAATAGAIYFASAPKHDSYPGIDDSDAHTAASFVPTGNVAASYCLDQNCRSLVSATLSLPVIGSNDTLVIYGASWIQRLTGPLKLVLEVNSGAALVDHYRQAEGVLLSYGIRLYDGRIAADLGLLKVLAFGGHDASVTPLGVPFGSVTFRF